MTRTLAASLPGSGVTVVPEHGHDLVDSAPEIVVEALDLLCESARESPSRE